MPIQKTTLTDEPWCTDHESGGGHEYCATKTSNLTDHQSMYANQCVDDADPRIWLAVNGPSAELTADQARVVADLIRSDGEAFADALAGIAQQLGHPAMLERDVRDRMRAYDARNVHDDGADR